MDMGVWAMAWRWVLEWGCFCWVGRRHMFGRWLVLVKDKSFCRYAHLCTQMHMSCVVIPSVVRNLLFLSVPWGILRSGHPRLHLKQNKVCIPPVHLQFFLLLSEFPLPQLLALDGSVCIAACGGFSCCRKAILGSRIVSDGAMMGRIRLWFASIIWFKVDLWLRRVPPKNLGGLRPNRQLRSPRRNRLFLQHCKACHEWAGNWAGACGSSRS